MLWARVCTKANAEVDPQTLNSSHLTSVVHLLSKACMAMALELGTLFNTSVSRPRLSSKACDEYWFDAAQPRLAAYSALAANHRDPSAIAETMYAVDAELVTLARVMADFRSRRNALSRAGSLPAEILSTIFAIRALQQPPAQPIWEEEDDPDVDNPLSLSQMELGWITVTHVSRHWRNVALADKTLWCRISFGLGRHWIDEMLARAHPAPIFYDRSFDREIAKRSVEWEISTLAENLPRIRILKMSGGRGDIVSSALQNVLVSSAPMLTHLELSCTSTDLPLPHVLRSSFVSSNASSLKYLSLRGIALPRGTWDWSSLQTLKITAIEEHAVSEDDDADESLRLDFSSQEVLFAVLTSMPSLQVLELTNCLPPTRSSSKQGADISHARLSIHLPCLRRLSISGLASECLSFFEDATMPNLRSLGVGMQHESTHEADIYAVLSRVSTHVKSFPSLLHRVHVRVLMMERLMEIHGWLSISETESPIQEEEPSLILSIRFDHAGSSLADFNHQHVEMLRHIPVKSVRCLSLDIPQVLWDVRKWRKLGHMFANVDRLHVVQSSNGFSFVNALRQDTTTDGTKSNTASLSGEPEEGHDMEPAIFAHLSMLEINGLYIGSHRGRDEADASLVRALRSRKAVDFGPHVLRLRKCVGLSAHIVARLKEIVHVVDWDYFTEPHAEATNSWGYVTEGYY